jgi:hypothetical protein
MKAIIMKTMTTALSAAILLAGLLPGGARGAEVTPAEAPDKMKRENRMKARFTVRLSACALAFVFCVVAAHAQANPKRKMTMPIPPSITIPDSVETRIGPLEFSTASGRKLPSFCFLGL